MMNRKKGLLAQAFEATYYNRAISKEAPFTSFFSAIFALPTKYKQYGIGKVEVSQDRNVYNWTERLLLPVTAAKNLAKLGTEYIWNLTSAALSEASDQLKAKANALSADAFDEDDDSYLTNAKIGSLKLLGYCVQGLSLLPWMVAKVGQSITSPFAAMKETATAVQRTTGSKFLGYFAAGLRGLISVGAYAAIAVFAAPAIAVPLAASGSVGSQIVAGLGAAANWVAGLPVISTIGSTFAAGMATVGSALGLSTAAGFASAAAIAATAIVATPVLAGLKAVVRYLSPFKPKPVNLQTLRLSAAQQPLLAGTSLGSNPYFGHTPNQPPRPLNLNANTVNAASLQQQGSLLSPLPHQHSNTHQHVHAAFSSSALSTSSAAPIPTGPTFSLQPVGVSQTPVKKPVTPPSTVPTLDLGALSHPVSPVQTTPALTTTTSSVLASSATTFSRPPTPVPQELTQQQVQQQQLEEQQKKNEADAPRSPKVC